MAVIDCNIFAASLRLKTDVKVILPFYPTSIRCSGSFTEEMAMTVIMSTIPTSFVMPMNICWQWSCRAGTT